MQPLQVSSEEENLLVQLRQSVQDLTAEEKLLESKNFVRWLRARGHNLKDAERMFRNHVAWRQEVGIDKLAENEIPLPKGWEEHFQFDFLGFDEDGGPIHLIYGKTFLVARAFSAGHRDILIQRLFSEIERAWNLCLKHSIGRDFIPQFVCIYDFSEVSYRLINSTEAWAATVSVPKIFDENYPECLKKIFIVNTPWILMWLCKLVLSTLSPKTAAKIVFLGCNKQAWRDEISKILSTNRFPKRYGGDADDNVESQDTVIQAYEAQYSKEDDALWG